MRSVVTTVLLLIACLLNQVIYQAVPADSDKDDACIIAVEPAGPETLLLRTSDLARLPKIAEALLTACVAPQVGAAAFARATDALEGRGGELRPTLQTLDVRLQV